MRREKEAEMVAYITGKKESGRNTEEDFRYNIWCENFTKDNRP